MTEFYAVMNIHASGMTKERTRVRIALTEFLDKQKWEPERIEEVVEELRLNEEVFRTDNLSRYCGVCGDEYHKKHPEELVTSLFGHTVHPTCAPKLERLWKRIGGYK